MGKVPANVQAKVTKSEGNTEKLSDGQASLWRSLGAEHSRKIQFFPNQNLLFDLVADLLFGHNV